MKAATPSIVVPRTRPDAVSTTGERSSAIVSSAFWGKHAAAAARWKVPAKELLVVPTDVTDPASIESRFETVKATYGRIDLLFNNA
ncbi:MAG TPA: SDR family NAD(P)-dependent oxidoreductase, partial [Acetobacteraceae bacterium]|nr:SDR family NAD(P)-dependent oxidoreductase [Acetobacteraceae bacterium]